MTQKFTSADTSINSAKLPKTFTFVKNWKPFSENLDYGGGKFDNATEYLAKFNVENFVYDPFNRTKEHNDKVLAHFQYGHGADTITCNNVLNVIDSIEEIKKVIRHCTQLLHPAGTAYFKIYEGDKSGQGKQTKQDCYQRNEKADAYIPLIQAVFAEVARHGDIIVASGPIAQ